MAKSRLIGDYPVIGIRPTIDGRRGKIKVRESLEDQTMNMAKSAAKLIEDNVFYSNGEHVKVIIADTTYRQSRRSCGLCGQVQKSRRGYYSYRHSLLVLRRGDNGYGSDDDKSRLGL